MSAEAPVPAPVTREVCSVCGEPWMLHTRLAQIEEYFEDEGYSMTARPVHAGDCIAVMRMQNQGPVGPAGPQGAMGMGAPGTTPDEMRALVRALKGN